MCPEQISAKKGYYRFPGSQYNLKKTVPGQIIVRYEADAGASEQAVVRREGGVIRRAELGLIDAEMVEVEGGSVAATIEDLEANPAVEYAVPDRVVYPMEYRDEERFPELWGLDNTGQEVLGRAGRPDVDAPEAAASSTGGEDVVVAVIDDGVDFGHPTSRGASGSTRMRCPTTT